MGFLSGARLAGHDDEAIAVDRLSIHMPDLDDVGHAGCYHYRAADRVPAYCRPPRLAGGARRPCDGHVRPDLAVGRVSSIGIHNPKSTSGVGLLSYTQPLTLRVVLPIIGACTSFCP